MSRFLNIIFAMDKNNGFGNKGKLPGWNCKDDLKFFREKTKQNVIITGRKTYEGMPVLKDREMYIFTKGIFLNSNQFGDKFIKLKDVKTLKDIKEESEEKNKKIFLIGGLQTINFFMQNHNDKINNIYISIINDKKEKYVCDTFFNTRLLENFVITEKDERDTFTVLTLTNSNFGEWQYLNKLQECLDEGNIKIGRNGETTSFFCSQNNLKFDLRNNSFPLLTTKKMFTRGIIEELLFFLRGETDTKKLEEKNVNIWKGNTNRDFLDNNGLHSLREGLMGPMYFYQIRNFNAPYNQQTGEKLDTGKNYFDQLEYVINQIKHDPSSRRIIATVLNPEQVFDGVLFPCHSIVLHFYVDSDNNELDMYCYNRSSDLFLGLPFNIASSSLLLIIIAKLCNLKPRFFYLGLGDQHLYSNQYKVAKQQLSRIPYQFPKIEISKELNSLEDLETLESTDFKITDYSCHSSIKVEMVS